jgi:hypothetical protein
MSKLANACMINTTILLFLLGPLFNSFGQDPKLTIEGTYKGYNVYIQNPFPPCGPVDTCPCVYKVLVNGIQTKDDIMAPAFQIDLSHYNFKIGDSLIIEIFHTKNCQPKVLSTYHGRKNVLEISSLTIDANSVLHWTTKNELVRMPFTVQVFRWNKWVTMGEVDGKGGPDGNVASYENTYEFKLLQHSGENKIRIKQDSNISTIIVWNSSIPEVTYNIDQLTKEIIFSAETAYEIYDEWGNLLIKGCDKEVDCKDLKYGIYFLNYDNKTEKIKFVKPEKTRKGK